MARLFVSLYLLIAIGLIGLSAVLEDVFFDPLPDNLVPGDKLIQLVETLNKKDSDVSALLSEAGFRVDVIDKTAIAWLPEEAAQLNKGLALSLFDPQSGHQLYLQTQQGALLEITVDTPKHEQSQFILYSSVFFVLLAGLLAIWVRPLWRDLERVHKGVEKQLPDGSIEHIQLGKGSMITTIADALNSMSEKVRQLHQSQRELTGAVAHEFRTPLSRLKFALAMRSAPDSQGWEAMNKDIDELEKLVQEMLSYTSMEVQLPEMNMSEIPLHSLCQQIIDNVEPSKRGELGISVIGEQVSVMADAHYLERAIENLLLNGCRYAKARIQINLTEIRGTVRIHVEDDGKGIPQELRERIFAPFYRPDDSRDRKRGGAGLGLAIVKRIALWHEGDCWVETSVMGGACFVISLPKV